jgi:hypothetical protein
LTGFITLPLITRQNGVSKNPDLFTLAQVVKTQLNPRSVLLVSQLDKYDHNGLDEYLELQNLFDPDQIHLVLIHLLGVDESVKIEGGLI